MPAELIKINMDKLKEFITERLKPFSEISGVYLFGSALDKMRPDSDIDIGIITKPGIIKNEKELEFLIAKLQFSLKNFEGHSFDIISIRDTGSILGFKIFREGQPVFIKDEEIVTDLLEFVSRKYSEDYPRYKEALELIVGCSF